MQLAIGKMHCMTTWESGSRMGNMTMIYIFSDETGNYALKSDFRFCNTLNLKVVRRKFTHSNAKDLHRIVNKQFMHVQCFNTFKKECFK